MGSGEVAIVALSTMISLKVTFSDGLGGVPITTAYPLSYCFLLYLPLGDERISGIKDAYSCIQGNWRRIGPPPHNMA